MSGEARLCRPNHNGKFFTIIIKKASIEDVVAEKEGSFSSSSSSSKVRVGEE